MSMPSSNMKPVCFNDTATTEIYTLALHDALPIYRAPGHAGRPAARAGLRQPGRRGALDRLCAAGGDGRGLDRKSTRLNSSHANISYVVFCLKNKQGLETVSYVSFRFVLWTRPSLC